MHHSRYRSKKTGVDAAKYRVKYVLYMRSWVRFQTGKSLDH